MMKMYVDVPLIIKSIEIFSISHKKNQGRVFLRFHCINMAVFVGVCECAWTCVCMCVFVLIGPGSAGDPPGKMEINKGRSSRLHHDPLT